MSANNKNRLPHLIISNLQNTTLCPNALRKHNRLACTDPYVRHNRSSRSNPDLEFRSWIACWWNLDCRMHICEVPAEPPLEDTSSWSRTSNSMVDIGESRKETAAQTFTLAVYDDWYNSRVSSLFPITAYEPIHAMAMSVDGRFLAIGNDGGRLEVCA